MKTIDEIINEMRNTVMNTGNIDSVNPKSEEINIEKIFLDIEKTANSMVQPSGKIKIFRPKSKKRWSTAKNILRKVDQLLQKNNIYLFKIRPSLKKIYQKYPRKKYVDGRALLEFNGSEFVDAIYRNILLREADTNSKRECERVLQEGLVSKLDLIDSLIQSEEGKKTPVKVTHLMYWRIRAKIKKIPYLGYIARWLYLIALLPKKLEELSAKNDKQESDLKRLIQDKEQYEFSKQMLDLFYLHYNEKVMPDSREKVKERSVVYIQRLDNYFHDLDKMKLNILDLGCGECEWIELLEENGYPAVGVDSNAEVIRKVKGMYPEFRIIENNAIDYLRSQQDNSYDLITAFHMIEHMDITTQMTLIKECYRVLRPKGMLIFETPNPANIFISTYYFYLDPTHIKIVPSELLSFMVEEFGFKVVEKLYLSPLNYAPYDYKQNDAISAVIYRFNMEQAYSIRAVKMYESNYYASNDSKS